MTEFEKAINRYQAAAAELHAAAEGLHLVLETSSRPPGRPNIQEIQRIAAEFYGLPVPAMWSRDRSRLPALARGIAMSLCREVLHCGTVEIGRAFARDHSDVSCATRRIRNLAETEPAIAAEVAVLRQRCRAALGISS